MFVSVRMVVVVVVVACAWSKQREKETHKKRGQAMQRISW